MVTEIQFEKGTNHWGRNVFERIIEQAEFYAGKWGLTDVYFHDHYSMNAIFYCCSAVYGECVLKIGGDSQDDEFIWENHILKEYNGRRYIHLYESDIDLHKRKKVMLLERVSPGIQLAKEPSLDKRLSVFTELFNDMHLKPANIEFYKKYSEGVEDHIKSNREKESNRDLYDHLLKVKEILAYVSTIYPQQMLLHGDLHYHNILKKGAGKYAVADPQGRIGPAILDTSRYILIEYYNTPVDERLKVVNYIIDYLGKSLEISSDMISKCFYMETTIFECWRASVGEYDINNVIFAENLMNN